MSVVSESNNKLLIFINTFILGSIDEFYNMLICSAVVYLLEKGLLFTKHIWYVESFVRVIPFLKLPGVLFHNL